MGQGSGLARDIEKAQLLSTAEDVLLDSNTTNLLFFASALLLSAAAALATSGDDLSGIFGGILAILGGVASVAAVAISTFFKTSSPRDPKKLTLVKCIESSQTLSYASDVGLLSLTESAAGGKVLATLERSGLLSALQKSGLLSKVEPALVALVENNAGAPLVILGLITSFASVLAAGQLWPLLIVPAGLAIFVLGLAVAILTPEGMH